MGIELEPAKEICPGTKVHDRRAQMSVHIDTLGA
jgi:hypothetical protein